MRTSAKVCLTGLLAAMLFAAAISTSSARSFEVSNQGFLVSWSRLEFASNVFTIRCQLTLDGSFHSRTIAKTARLIGHITEVRIKRESCTNGELLIENASLPWHVTYEGFTGALPNITGIFLLLSRSRLRISLLGLSCWFGNETDNVTYRANVNAAGEITTLEPVAGRNTSTTIEGRNPGELFGCPGGGNYIGEAIVSVLNAWTTKIRVKLI